MEVIAGGQSNVKTVQRKTSSAPRAPCYPSFAGFETRPAAPKCRRAIEISQRPWKFLPVPPRSQAPCRPLAVRRLAHAARRLLRTSPARDGRPDLNGFSWLYFLGSPPKLPDQCSSPALLVARILVMLTSAFSKALRKARVSALKRPSARSSKVMPSSLMR